MLLPVLGQEAGPVGGAGDLFSVWVTEDEGDRKFSFTKSGVLFEGPALEDLNLSFRDTVEIGYFNGPLILPSKGLPSRGKREEFV